MYAWSPDGLLASDTTHLVLSALEAGVRLSVLDGRLCCRAPRGADVRDHVSALELASADCAALLRRSAGLFSVISSDAGTRDRVDFAPLSLSQLSHWTFHELGTRSSIRTCGLALRLCGALEEDALKETVEEVCSRHEALRTKIVNVGGTPVQCVYASAAWTFAFEDLTSIATGAREREVCRLLVRRHTDPLNVSTDPLLSVVLIKLDESDRVLFVAMDHLISDGISVNVLMRDLLTGYVRKLRGGTSSTTLPAQFADYSIWERRRYREWMTTRGAYWSRHLAGSKALRMPSATSAHPSNIGLQCVPVHLDCEMTEALLHRARAAGTTAAMVVFAAFAALLLRWCEVSEAVIQYQSHGRFVPELQDAIGYFAFRRYLRVGLQANDRLIDFLQAVAAEYVNSLENETFPSAGVADTSGELARNPCFNWITRDQPDDAGATAGPTLEGRLRCHRIRYEDTVERIAGVRAETDLLLALAEVGKEVHGVVQCPLEAISIEAMRRFADNLLRFTWALVRHPEKVVGEILIL